MGLKEVTSSFWDRAKKILHVLGLARISIVIVCILWTILLNVPQTTDAIMAMGDFGDIHHYVIFILAILFLAVQLRYWARIFYYMCYDPENDGKGKIEMFLVNHLPGILGVTTLVLPAIAFFTQSAAAVESDVQTRLLIVGILLTLLAVLFLLFLLFRQSLFKLKDYAIPKVVDGRCNSFGELPDNYRNVILGTTIFSFLFFLSMVIAPIAVAPFLGDSIVILVLGLGMLMALGYWIFYVSKRLKFPFFTFLVLFVILISNINGNKNIRFTEKTVEPKYSISTYFEAWYKQRKAELADKNAPVPLIMVLSEGGGIRAAYWSAGLLSRIQDDYPHFSSHLFLISGVSGGSFGASVFTGLIKKFVADDNRTDVSLAQYAKDIVGKDYLSPIVGSLFTRGLLQSFLPFPVFDFDHSKVFERTWEKEWRNSTEGDNSFALSYTDLWNNDPLFKVPALFLNTTNVETGLPITLSPIRLDANTTGDLEFKRLLGFYDASMTKRDVPLSTASLLSARFPFVTPAGMAVNGDIKMGFVDGGYYNNTGVSIVYDVLYTLEEELKMDKIRPIVIYLKNGEGTTDQTSSVDNFMYQLGAPLNVTMQIRDTHDQEPLAGLSRFVKMYDGAFEIFSLDEGEVPLGWALSEMTQNVIDTRINEIMTDKKDVLQGILYPGGTQ